MPTNHDLPPHDFPDQAIREQLQNPENLRELLHEVLGDLADGFVCEEREVLKREFPLEDWRHRESDLLLRIPYRTPADTVPVLVCVLLEHQSRPDERMALRTLLYTVLWWEREWKAWEALPAPRPPLRLTPVVPIVFHTGQRKWRKRRTLRELIAGPQAFRKYAPAWRPLFLDLAGKTPAELLQAAGEWFHALAIVRAEQENAAAFRAVLQEVLRRLEGLAERDRGRWHDLLHFVLVWALYCRPRVERQDLVESAQASQTNVARQKEVQGMGMTIAEALREEGKVEGEAKGRLEGAREILCYLLETKFGRVPEPHLQRIQATTDLSRLKAAAGSVARLTSVDELQL
jgi:hypothetical protein